ncbi:zinc ribbon domain-containing protein [Streptomyces sp. NPDC005784]|uniref:zinc ribbon domain-containing protein n=1 Tax=Streptomyces sp. NPDC005784 TaxID=3364731 RepID=UPI00367F9AF7
MLARTYDLVRFEKLNIKNMTRSARGTVAQPGRMIAQKAGPNRAILAQGWGVLRQRTGHKAPGRIEDVPAPFTSLRCSACGWIDKNSRKSQAEFVCSFCGFTCTRTPMQPSTSRQDRAEFPAPGAQPVPEGRHRPNSGRASVNLNPPRLKSPSFKRGRMSRNAPARPA